MALPFAALITPLIRSAGTTALNSARNKINQSGMANQLKQAESRIKRAARDEVYNMTSGRRTGGQPLQVDPTARSKMNLDEIFAEVASGSTLTGAVRQQLIPHVSVQTARGRITGQEAYDTVRNVGRHNTQLKKALADPKKTMGSILKGQGAMPEDYQGEWTQADLERLTYEADAGQVADVEGFGRMSAEGPASIARRKDSTLRDNLIRGIRGMNLPARLETDLIQMIRQKSPEELADWSANTPGIAATVFYASDGSLQDGPGRAALKSQLTRIIYSLGANPDDYAAEIEEFMERN